MNDNSLRRKLVKALKRDGWERDRWNCTHEVFKHATKEGSVPIPTHITNPRFAIDILTKQALIKDAKL